MTRGQRTAHLALWLALAPLLLLLVAGAVLNRADVPPDRTGTAPRAEGGR